MADLAKTWRSEIRSCHPGAGLAWRYFRHCEHDGRPHRISTDINGFPNDRQSFIPFPVFPGPVALHRRRPKASAQPGLPVHSLHRGAGVCRNRGNAGHPTGHSVGSAALRRRRRAVQRNTAGLRTAAGGGCHADRNPPARSHGRSAPGGGRRPHRPSGDRSDLPQTDRAGLAVRTGGGYYIFPGVR